MADTGEARHVSFGAATPQLAPTAWVAPGAVLVGAVTVRARASVWFAAVLRADRAAIEVGERSNIQDGVVVHADPGFPTVIGRRVSVGHRTELHGWTVDDESLIGMGAVVLNGARIGRGSLVAAGSVIREGTVVPASSLVAGVPGNVRRPLTEPETEHIRRNVAAYEDLVQACMKRTHSQPTQGSVRPPPRHRRH